ncbi:hypothetical protein MMC17_004877 [Xylographa soralifera]|nr:hypothetical protein [Xylographa soralifera]
MLDVSTNLWFSEGTELSPRPISLKSPPVSSSPSPSRVLKLVFTTAICDITPPITASSSPVHRPNDLPEYLRIPIPSPSRGHPANTRSIQTSRYTTKRGLPVHTSVSHENAPGQKIKMLSSSSLPTAQFFYGEPNHYKLEEYDDEDKNEDDSPLGYPYETCTDIFMFAREYLCGMLDLVMTWLEDRRGMRAST